ncbi:hypothetical protein [Actinomycetospora cinnamomea]|uniref:YrhK-like protein n=1 Tax=Actinomycetospora cinnamomea TaxID=663609 RepID=A0A2U1F107_9PSEU|nr:hypothetical protein [Actinomycetospora cinnamomea]PVZ05856.1 hypothetical protein C8D89_114112 [Actinomycetospora cinnamomea]
MSATVGPQVPSDWQLVRSGGPRPFTTWREYRGPDDLAYTWQDRPHRKGHGARRGGARPRSGYWAPDRLAWWVAVSFVVGSALFILGAAGSLVPSAFGGDKTAMSLFAEVAYTLGALLYTAAVYGQILESLNEDDRITSDGSSRPPESWRWVGFKIRDLGFVWAFVFLIGAVIFNYETIAALLSTAHLIPEEVGLWWTSLVGALFFLVASVLQTFEAGHGYFPKTLRNVSWWVGAMFVLGSVGFTVGAVPGFSITGSLQAEGEPGASIVKIGFLVGGIAFLVGSWLMLPELGKEMASEQDTDASAEKAA